MKRYLRSAEQPPEFTCLLDLKDLPFEHLRVLCAQRGLVHHGSMQELYNRLRQHQSEGRRMQCNDADASERLRSQVIAIEADVAETEVEDVPMPNWVLPMFHRIMAAATASKPPKVEVSDMLLSSMSAEAQKLFRDFAHSDEQGDQIWGLAPRTDARIFRAAYTVLLQAGFSNALAFFILGFLHILYWPQAISMALAHLLADPIIVPCDIRLLCTRGPLLDEFCAALARAWTCLASFFEPLRIYHLKLVPRKTPRRRRLLVPTRNPCNWNRRSSKDWHMLLNDALQLRWGNACRKLSLHVSGSTTLDGTFTYAYALQVFKIEKLEYYTGLPRSYNSIHFLRLISFATGRRIANTTRDWRTLQSMGGGVERWALQYSEVTAALETARILQTGDAYGLDDLCVYLCLRSKPNR